MEQHSTAKSAESSTNLDAALCYREKGFSVIPCGKDKKPLLKTWLPYQKEQATEQQMRVWWGKYPDANIGIVTGLISGVCVIDQDDMNKTEIDNYLPDAVSIPTAITPRGGRHYYFKMPDEKIGNNTGAISGCDFRGEGGYVIAPPSINGTGKAYAWQDGMSIFEAPLAPLPSAYISFINSFALKGYKGGEVKSKNGLQKTSDDFNGLQKMFTEPGRDEGLFHTANCLIKGGMKEDLARKVLEMLALQCDPPFSLKDAQTKVDSALKRLERRERNFSEEIREWVMTSNGFFLTSDVYKELQMTSRQDQKNCFLNLIRMCEGKNKILERHGEKRGCFRVIDNQCEEIDFLSASMEGVSISWPFQIENLVKTLPKNIIVIAGEPNAGKTAFLLNVAEMNMNKHEFHYFSSEMGALELQGRLTKFDRPLNSWKVKFIERASNFADVIKPDAINIIDFLEVHDEFYKIGGLIKDIYDKLNTGIAIIAIQKNKGNEFGLGGMRGLEKARLYLTMEPGKIRIVKGKNWTGPMNPNGLECEFKLIQGCHFQTEATWKRP